VKAIGIAEDEVHKRKSDTLPTKALKRERLPRGR